VLPRESRHKWTYILLGGLVLLAVAASLAPHRSSSSIALAPGTRLIRTDRSRSGIPYSAAILTVDLRSDGVRSALLISASDRASGELGSLARAAGAFAALGDSRGPAPLVSDGRLVAATARPALAAGVTAGATGRLVTLAERGSVELPGGTRPLAALNDPDLPRNGIGLYTSAGFLAVASRGHGEERTVVISHGRVRSPVAGALPAGDEALLGVGAGARELARLSPGDPVRVRVTTSGADGLRFAIGVGRIVLSGGRVRSRLPGTLYTSLAGIGFADGGTTMDLVVITPLEPRIDGVDLSDLAVVLEDLRDGAGASLGSAPLLAHLPEHVGLRRVAGPSSGSVPAGIALVGTGVGRTTQR
jgi:hypothetical protein